MKITKENYDEVKEELRKYEKRMETIKRILNLRNGLLEQVYNKSDNDGYTIVDEHKNEKFIINLSLAYILVDALNKYLERIKNETVIYS